MSADNYYVVRKHPKGGFTYVMGFASEEVGQYDIPVRKGHWGWDLSWPTVDEAFTAAINDYSEYGVSVHPECRAASMSAVETLERCLDRALTAMNEACLIAVREGSPKAMGYIADFLSNSDAVDEDQLAIIDAELNGRTFPPDLGGLLWATRRRT